MVEIAPAVECKSEYMLRRWWAVSGLALVAATWNLWTPQTEFPQVPLFGWAGSLPEFVDWLGFGFLLCSLVAAAFKPGWHRSWIVFAVALGILILLDQHRLQPWAWQLLLMAIWWSGSNARQFGNLPHVVFTVSIYFWSAVSKLDAEFAASQGQTLIEALFQSVGVSSVAWPAIWKSRLAMLLPVGELSVAIGLCWPRTQRVGLIAATAFHIGLLFALGPLGLSHKPAVLLWNVAFIGHVWLLIGGRVLGRSAVVQFASDGVTSSTSITPLVALRISLLAFVFIWPLTERWGLCDRWLAWSVYAAGSERVGVTLTAEGLRRLPESAQRCVADGELPLDRWSLAALDAPIYPQLRFQFGIVEWLRRRCGDENLIEVIVQQDVGGIERLTIDEFEKRQRAYWINVQPRDAFPAGNRP